MVSTARYAYLQARLQGTGDFANYLQLAQQTALRPWVVSMHAGQDSSEIEQVLRRQYRQHI